MPHNTTGGPLHVLGTAFLTVSIGTSGWSYAHWNNVLYDPSTPARDRLGEYVTHFNTVELNASFYRWPKPASFASWHRRLPAEFTMSVKAPRGLTHGKRLYEPELWIARIKAGWHELAEQRAVLLVQLHPAHERDHERLDYFLRELPNWIRVAVEFRHPSWVEEQTFSLLESHGCGYCVTSGARLPCVLRATAEFVYLRLHGPDQNHLYAGSYPDQDLQWWADRIREWTQSGRDVYAYFNNDGAGNAVHNARTLRSLVAHG